MQSRSLAHAPLCSCSAHRARIDVRAPSMPAPQQVPRGRNRFLRRSAVTVKGVSGASSGEQTRGACRAIALLVPINFTKGGNVSLADRNARDFLFCGWDAALSSFDCQCSGTVVAVARRQRQADPAVTVGTTSFAEALHQHLPPLSRHTPPGARFGETQIPSALCPSGSVAVEHSQKRMQRAVR
jgi:hypothetical protein